MVIEKMKKIRTLVASNDELAEKLTNAKGLDSVNAILSSYGIELTDTDVNELKEMLSSDEIPEEFLELVAGGIGWRDFFHGFFDGLTEGWEVTKDFFKKIFK